MQMFLHMFFPLFSEENNVPKHSLKVERWQGLPHVNKVKQYKLCCPLRSACLFTHACRSHIQQKDQDS